MEVVCGIVRDPTGRFLICMRAPGKELAGHWEFPGGKMEPGETPERALVRELREELGIDIVVGPPMAPVDWREGAFPIRLLPYHCTIRRGTPRALEHQAVEWCPPSRLRDRRWAPADLPVVAELDRTISERIAKDETLG